MKKYTVFLIGLFFLACSSGSSYVEDFFVPEIPFPVENLKLENDNLYGDVTNPWNDKQDPRILMGTYTKTTAIQDTGESQLNVDFNSPIYKHTNYGGNDGTNYIFKITDIGWVITEDTSPNQVTAENIKLTCFQDDIIDCIKYSWFWSYNSNIDSVQSVKISNGNCPSYDR